MGDPNENKSDAQTAKEMFDKLTEKQREALVAQINLEKQASELAKKASVK